MSLLGHKGKGLQLEQTVSSLTGLSLGILPRSTRRARACLRRRMRRYWRALTYRSGSSSVVSQLTVEAAVATLPVVPPELLSIYDATKQNKLIAIVTTCYLLGSNSRSARPSLIRSTDRPL